MATLVLTTVGTLVGGPIGGALGAVVGNSIDHALLEPRREGPRLKDVRVASATYGEPIARHYGRVRTGGALVWGTDLIETREKSGGKGRPKTTTYSYAISFAVLLSSGPIDGVGRIWADGNLLRGAAGDLKTEGALRVYLGTEDQAPDPLLRAALGAQCPAYRGCAYAVFEDLALGDFGNRIPALSFEVFARSGSQVIPDLARANGISAAADTVFPGLIGFSHEGGSAAQVFAVLDGLQPLIADPSNGNLVLRSRADTGAAPIALPPAAAWQDGDFGVQAGRTQTRSAQAEAVTGPVALRYYDPARDYQPGLQRATGSAERGRDQRALEFPGVLEAAEARRLVDGAAVRAAGRRETMAWRCATLDPAIRPGAYVTAPGVEGVWRVEAWEWRSGGIELSLERHLALGTAAPTADPGSSWSGPDRPAQPTTLIAFEVPWDGYGSANARQAYLATSAPSGRWSGAALYAVQDGALSRIGQANDRRALVARLAEPLRPSAGLRFEGDAALVIDALSDLDAYYEATLRDIAAGANRLRVGREILQFAYAEKLGPRQWRLSGLLRARGGTESAAGEGHPAGRATVLMDDNLMPLGEAALAAGESGGFAAIGQGDAAPAVAPLSGKGSSVRPLSPVHPRVQRHADGARTLTWIRRARGGWDWLAEVEQPLNEETERYTVICGALAAPRRTWAVDTPALHLTRAQWDDLATAFPGEPLWVRQRGRAATSEPLFLTALPPASTGT